MLNFRYFILVFSLLLFTIGHSQCTDKWTIVGDTNISYPYQPSNNNSLVFCPIVTDSSEIPYIAYYVTGSANCGSVTVKKLNDTNWVNVGPLVTGSGNANSLSMAVDYQNRPYVAYSDDAYIPTNQAPYFSERSQLMVFRFNGIGWDDLGAPIVNNWAPIINTYFAYVDIKTFKDTVYVVFIDGRQNDKLRVIKYDGVSWMDIGTGISNGNCFSASLQIDNSGTLFVGFADGSFGRKGRVVKYSSGNWIPVGPNVITSSRADFIQMALDNNGNPYCIFADSLVGGRASVIKYNGSSWQYLGAAGFSPGTVANMPYISVNSQGDVYAYFCITEMNFAISVMKYNSGTGWSNAGTNQISEGNSLNGYMTLSKKDVPYIAYGPFSLNVKKLDCLNLPPDTTGKSVSGKSYCNDLSISPNYSGGIFNLTPNIQAKSLEVYNSLGQLVFENNLQASINYIDISGQVNGVYIVRIQDTQGKKCLTKIIKNQQ